MGEERQCHPRTCRPLDVTLDASGRQWQGKTVNLGPYGAKVAFSVKFPLAPGMNIGVRLALPDGDLSLRAMVGRTDADGVALNFGDLEGKQFQRLKELVDSLLVQEWSELLIELQGGQPVPAPQANVAPGQPSVFARQRGRANAPKPSVTPAEDDSEADRLRDVASRLGLGNLQLPKGPLTRPWREFLKRLEAQEK